MARTRHAARSQPDDFGVLKYTRFQRCHSGHGPRFNQTLGRKFVQMKRRLVAVTLGLVALLSFARVAVAGLPPDFCGPDERSHYRWGAILIILEEATTDSIGDVIERMGGDPAADVLAEFTVVRDALVPDGVADDLSETAVHQVAVPIGQEHEMSDAYRADPAVYAAAVDRETIGTVTPDTALPVPSPSPLLPLGASLVLIAGAIAACTAGGSLRLEQPCLWGARRGWDCITPAVTGLEISIPGWSRSPALPGWVNQPLPRFSVKPRRVTDPQESVSDGGSPPEWLTRNPSSQGPESYVSRMG